MTISISYVATGRGIIAFFFNIEPIGKSGTASE
jgi:hypothetical protein